ncbi:MAG: SMI1/KNR4 family protein [Tannerellaceae bacterium]|nr:SMI1/KNR4 family protein [Tannerellaceae bacterium]
MKDLKNALEKFLVHIEELGGDSDELIFEEPATEDEILKIETQLSYKIPEDFRNCLLTISKDCEFKWFLPDDLKLPDELRGIFCGEIHWGLEFIIPFNENKEGWIKTCFPDIQNDYDKIWHNKFVFQEVGNGDLISVDLNPDTYGQIVYLSHDNGEGHGFIMAKSFSELLKNWVPLGCPGGEDWQWLPFTENKTSGINPNCENAKLWYKTLKIDI